MDPNEETQKRVKCSRKYDLNVFFLVFHSRDSFKLRTRDKNKNTAATKNLSGELRSRLKQHNERGAAPIVDKRKLNEKWRDLLAMVRGIKTARQLQLQDSCKTIARQDS